MKQSWMKKLTAAIGFLVMMFVFTTIPGTKADAAVLEKGVSGYITVTESGENHTLTMAKDGYVGISVKSRWIDTTKRAVGQLAVYKGKTRISPVKTNDFYNSDTTKQYHFFALKKGTYRIKIKLNDLRVSGINGDNMAYDEPNQYQVGVDLKYVPDQGGTKRTKATAIKLKTAKQGIVALTDARATGSSKNGDWFKFKLKKKTKVKLAIAAISTNRTDKEQTLEYAVYGSASKKLLRSFSNGKLTKLPKGTYYIKVYKSTKADSGYYKIGLNKNVK